MIVRLTYRQLWLRVSALLLVAVFLLPAVVQAAPFEEMVKRVNEQMGLESDELAQKFIIYIQDAVEQIHENFSKIASHQTPRKEKDELIKATIEKYFDGNFATVQTSTPGNPKIRAFPVEIYLDKLSKLSDEGRYDMVTLLFDKSYLSMGTIEKDSKNPAYEFKVNMWQMFEGCKKDQPPCYRDYTERGIHFIFRQVANSWELKVKLITGMQPIPFREGVWK